MRIIEKINISIVVVFIIIPIVLVLSPFFIIFGIISWIKHKSELKKILSENDGKIVFLYGEYHEFDFLSYFKNHHPAIKCLEVPNHYISDILINHLIRNRKAKSLPQLIKIEGKNIIQKEHYNSFKYYVRRNNDAESFYELIESSIKNLERENDL